MQEIELDLESKKAGYFLYPEDIWVKPEDLLPALKSAYTSLGGKLVETLVKTFKLGKVKKIELFDHKSHSLGAFDGLVVASGNFAKSALSELGIAAKNLKKTKGWKSKVLRGPSCRNAFSTKDSIINLPQIEGLSSPHKVPFLEVRKVRPLVWREESVETSFSDDPNTKQARHGFRYEAVDQAPLVGPLAGAFDPFIALNICHHKSGFVTALPSAEILWKSFSKESLFPWEEALSPSRFRSKE